MRSFSLFPAGRSSRSAAFWRTRLHGRPSSPTSNRSQTATGATADEKERSLRGPTSGKQVVPCAGRADEEEHRETCFGCVPLPLACFLHSLALFFGSLLSPVLQGVAFLLWVASTGGAGGAGAVPSGKTAVDLPDGSGNSLLSSAAQALSLFIGSVGFLANEFVDAPALGLGVVASKGENAPGPEVSRAPRAFLQHPSTALPGVPKRVGPAGRAAQVAIDDHRTAQIAIAHRPGEGGAAAHFFCANLVSCLFSAVSCASGGLGIYANQQTPYLLFFVSLFLYHWPAKAWSLATTLLQAGETERGRDEQSVLNRSPPADSNSVQATTLHLAGAASFPTLSSALSWDRVQIGFVLADFVLATYLLLVHHRFLCGHVETAATEHCVGTPVEEAHCSTSRSRDDEQEDDHEVRFFTHPQLDSSSSSAADIRAYVDEQRFFGFDSALPYARPHGGGDCTSEDETASFLYDLSRLGDLSIPEIAPVFEETPEDLLGDEEGAEEHLRSLERSLSSLFREGEETAWE